MSTTLAEPPAETATPRVALYANQDKPALKQVRPYCGGQEPLFLAALAFSCGIVAANCLWRAPWIWLGGFCLAALTAIAALRRSPQLAAVLTFAAIVSLGGFYLQARDAAQPAIAENLQPFATGQDEVEVTAHVTREGLIRDSPYGGDQESVDVETEELRLGNHVLAEPLGIRLTVYTRKAEEEEARATGTESSLPVYRYGQRLRFPAKLRMPHNYRDPGAMDVAGYLASQGIRLTGSVHASEIEELPGFAGSRLDYWRSRARRSMLDRIARLWPSERAH